MRRLAPVIAATATVGLLIPLLLAPQLRLLGLLPAAGAIGLVAVALLRRGTVVEPGWSGPRPRIASGTPADVSPKRSARPSSRSVVAALSRVEAGELVSGPWFGIGVGLLGVILLLFAIVFPDDNGTRWAEIPALASWFAHPLVGMVVLATHRAVTRAGRDGADELLDTCPTSPTIRTWGWLATAWVPVVAFLCFLAVLTAALALRSPHLYGPLETGAVAQVLSALVLCVGGVVLGVALGRWVPFALAPVAAVGAIAFLSIWLSTFRDPGWNPLHQLSTAPTVATAPLVFTRSPVWAHLAWVVALIAAVLVVALAATRRDRAVAVSGVAACVLLAAAGVAATRPMPGSSAARLAGLIADPARHQSCRSAGSIQVCSFPGHEELAARVAAEVTPVAAALPPAAPPLTLRQRYPDKIEDLPPEVTRLLPGGVPPVPPGEVPLGFDAARRMLWGPRLRASFFALGLPTAPDPGKRPVVVAGQARGVVALWLAARGLGPGPTRELTTGIGSSDSARRSETAFEAGYLWPESCATSPVVWSAQDLRAARALVALPDEVVRAVMHGGWERWRDPATGTDELLPALGLPPAGPFDVVETRTEDPC